MKTITVKEDTWKNLHLMKYALSVDTIGDVLNKLILSYKTNSIDTSKINNPFSRPIINKGEQDGRTKV